jgi:tRNA threonylcarbamoyladenosine modification (KEOPS) complex Cgi121 subunit
MDFISESFPNTRVHIALSKINLAAQQQTDESQSSPIVQCRAKVAALADKNKISFTVINAQCIVSLMHLNIAVSRALVNRRDGKLKTSSFGNELVYYCSPNHSI